MNEKIIHILKSHKEFVSGEEISRTLDISRAAIWKYIEEFRRQGYEIHASPRQGYRLLFAPDKFLPWEVSYELGTKVIGKNLICRETTSSTMDEALQLGFKGMPEGTVVLAESQTQGRGRMGRGWVSPKGKGIYLSVILRPQMSLRDVARITLMGAVAVCEAIQTTAGVPAGIKWPNDILVNGRKVAGILTELNAQMDSVHFVVIGIGLNVNTPATQLPPEATSLKIAAKKNFLRLEIVKEILRSLEYWYGIFNEQGFDPVAKRWKELSVTLGRKVRVQENGQMIDGEAVDLAQDGGLLIRDASGAVLKKMAGDVILKD